MLLIVEHYLKMSVEWSSDVIFNIILQIQYDFTYYEWSWNKGTTYLYLLKCGFIWIAAWSSSHGKLNKLSDRI